MPRKKSGQDNFVIFFLIMLLLMFKILVAAEIRGWRLSLKEIVLLAFVDAFFMFLMAIVLSRTHAAASITIDGD